MGPIFSARKTKHNKIKEIEKTHRSGEKAKSEIQTWTLDRNFVSKYTENKRYLERMAVGDAPVGSTD